ncbi:MAG TPA: putative metal-dependent hydrolase [Roseiflexaceae bacterium]|nr:putative metal-dependent hydrolase [Roseiflexaceae bacterium]
MTPLDIRAARIARIAALPEELAALVGGLSDARLDTHAPDDPWTVRQVTHHMADSHANAFIRTKLILTEEHPTLKPYDQDAWAALPDTCAMPVGASLELLRGLHARWVRLFESLGPADWGRAALHPEIGEVTIDDILETYAHHCNDHLAQIRRILTGAECGGDLPASAPSHGAA